jgi:hypothetical protein
LESHEEKFGSANEFLDYTRPRSWKVERGFSMKVTARFLRSILLCSFLLVSFGLTAPTLSLEAQDTRSGHEFDYYSDATYSCLVGIAVWCNDGSNYRYGQVTPYVIVSDSSTAKRHGSV